MKNINKLVGVGLILALMAIGLFAFNLYRQGVLDSTTAFELYLESFGVWEALVFIMIQIILVMIPFMPTTLGGIVGIVLFGPFLGFLYNYFAICTGSCINFLLSKKFGLAITKRMIGKTLLEKNLDLISDQDKFNKVFTAAIFLPGAPDDYLCYLAGLTKMRFSQFLKIILLGKPLSIAVFTFGAATIFHFLLALFRN